MLDSFRAVNPIEDKLNSIQPAHLNNDEAISMAQRLKPKIHEAIVAATTQLRLEIAKDAATLRGKDHGSEDEFPIHGSPLVETIPALYALLF